MPDAAPAFGAMFALWILPNVQQGKRSQLLQFSLAGVLTTHICTAVDIALSSILPVFS
jgi:hypothetical protein